MNMIDETKNSQNNELMYNSIKTKKSNYIDQLGKNVLMRLKHWKLLHVIIKCLLVV